MERSVKVARPEASVTHLPCSAELPSTGTYGCGDLNPALGCIVALGIPKLEHRLPGEWDPIAGGAGRLGPDEERCRRACGRGGPEAGDSHTRHHGVQPLLPQCAAQRPLGRGAAFAVRGGDFRRGRSSPGRHHPADGGLRHTVAIPIDQLHHEVGREHGPCLGRLVAAREDDQLRGIARDGGMRKGDRRTRQSFGAGDGRLLSHGRTEYAFDPGPPVFVGVHDVRADSSHHPPRPS